MAGRSGSTYVFTHTTRDPTRAPGSRVNQTRPDRPVASPNAIDNPKPAGPHKLKLKLSDQEYQMLPTHSIYTYLNR